MICIRTVFITSTLALAFLLLNCRDDSPEAIEQRIAASEELRHIDQICSELPKPSSFKQVKKGISGNARVTIIYYQYESGAAFDSVKAFFEDPATLRSIYTFVSVDDRQLQGYASELTLKREDVMIAVEYRPQPKIYNLSCIK